jgi:hypothetical protein
MTTIKISPREAELATWSKATDEAIKDGVNIAPVIILEFAFLGPGEHLSWEVTYWPVPVDYPPNGITPLLASMGENYSSQFTVDAVTGEVTETDLGPKLPANR